MSEKIPVVLLTLLFLTFTGLSQSPNRPSPLSADKTTQIVSDDEYRIYEILYAEWFGKEKLENFVIDPNLDTCTKVTWFANPENSKIPESKTDEIEANCGRMSLGTLDANRFRSKQKIIFVTRNEEKKFFPDGTNCEVGWKSYFRKYPNSNGYMSVSRVGFDNDKHFAAVYFSYIRGCLNGEGHHVFLEKVDGTWKVVYKLMTWAS